ncbi:MAG: AmmeMemoRadiSam system protein B [Acidobacteriota bacterium]
MKNIHRIFFACLFFLIAVAWISGGDDLRLSGIRPAAVSGQFYPSDPEKLTLAIRQYLEQSDPVSIPDPVSIMVPHAGYIYSGQICADAYRQVMGRDYDVFVILGVNHTTAGFRGIALTDYKGYHTPLGNVPIDRRITSALLDRCSDCTVNREVHAREHSIEVQIPFLQVLFPEPKIVPVIIHPPDIELCLRFGRTLAEVLKNQNALIIISSDLSHYPDSVEAAKADRETLETIASMDTLKISSLMRSLEAPELDTRACGEAAILSGVTSSNLLGARHAIVAGYSNSGEMLLGDKTRSVGYGAVLFTPGDASADTQILNRPEIIESSAPLSKADKRTLLQFARTALEQYLNTRTVPLARNFSPDLTVRRGAFVTLKKNGQLRGCIGSVLPEDELARTVGKMALRAALEDPRFVPVTLDELAGLEIEVSVLSPINRIADPSRIVIGTDGVLLIKDGKSAVFLPQVATEQSWHRTEMLNHLCTKAGLETDCWKQNATLYIFQADVFGEHQ